MRSARLLLSLAALLQGCNLIAYDIIASGRDLTTADAGAERIPDAGTQPNPDAGTTDPCDTDNGGCATVATCESSGKLVTCTCPQGYTGDGKYCDDIEECLSAGRGGCDPNATCTNLPGSHRCECKSGFTGDGTTCTDTDECATNNGGCDVNAVCANTPGSFTCTCRQGYDGTGFQCIKQPWPIIGNLPATRTGLASTIDRGRLYVSGGRDQTTTTAAPQVWMTDINPDGSLAGFTALQLLPDGLVEHCMVAVSGYLFTIGGSKPTGPNIIGENANVGVVALKQDGTIGFWGGTTPLPSPRTRIACVVKDNRIYVMGGAWEDKNAMPMPKTIRTADVLVGTVNPADGTIASWQTTTPLPEPVAALAAAVSGDTIYITGGDSGALPSRRDTHYAKIQSDGTLSAWTSTNAPNFGVTAVDATKHVVVGGFLYVLGPGAERAEIQTDGSLGPWSTFTPDFSGAQRRYHFAETYQGFVYVGAGIGGQFGNQPLSDIRMELLE